MPKYHPNSNVDALLDAIGQSLLSKRDKADINDRLNKVGQDIKNGFEDFATNLVQGIGEAFDGSAIDKLRQLLNKHDGDIAQSKQQLGDLQDKTQKLLGVIGYAYSTHTDTIKCAGLDTWTVIPQNRVIGASVGAELTTSGRIRLNSKGLWFIQSQLLFDWYAFDVARRIQHQIRVYDPHGNLHAIKESIEDSTIKTTTTCLLPVTVPAAGYTVEVRVTGALGRGVLGGEQSSFLSVDKRSQETN